jgi:putative ABC transport system permease protein
MLRNYLRDAWRHLIREKGFSAITIFGLALGLAACILITLFVADEFGYDRYNTRAGRIYRIAADIHLNGPSINDVATPPAMGMVLQRDYPAVEKAVRIRAQRKDVVVHAGDKAFIESNVVSADPSLFEIFTLPMLSGDPGTALSSPNSLVLSASAAKRYFNSTDVLGQTLRLDDDTVVYRVTGVIRDMPAQSHVHLQVIKSLEQGKLQWIGLFGATYILVRPGVTTADIDRMLAQTVDRYILPNFPKQLRDRSSGAQRKGDYFRYYAVPLTRIHLYSNLGHEFEVNGSIRYVVFFMIVAVLILLVACVNFINLSVARSMRRLREIGVRKVLGAGRRRLAVQFLLESVVMTAIAMGLAVVFVLLLLPWFDRLTGKSFDPSFLLSPRVFVSFGMTILGIGLLSGGYPAFLLSGIQPLNVLRGQMVTGFRTGVLRTALLVFQFSVAMILIIGTGVIYSQLYYIQHSQLGYTREQVVTVKDTEPLGAAAWTFAQAAGQLPGVKNVTVSNALPHQKVITRGFFQNRSATEMATVDMGDWHVDVNYLPTLEMDLVAGRNFSSQLPTDSGCVLINETAARVLGYAFPLGQRVYTGADSNSAYTIIGVVKDFNTGSLRYPIDPVVFRLYRDGLFVTFRLSPGNITGTLNAIRGAYTKIANGHPFVYAFLDDEFNRLYLADQRTGRIFTVFSLLSLFIAGIGIFGLVAAATEQRTRELGIRRVLGARMIHLILLLLQDYGLAIGVAVLIALPASFWMMHNWLQEFAYRTPLHPLLFIVAPLCTILLAALIVGAKVSRTSGINPARTLRVN